jgi:hypothetical protein
MISSLDAPPHNPLTTDSWDGYGAERAELVDHIASTGIDDVTFVTGDIHTFFAGDVTRTGRQTVRGEDRTDPVNGPARATEFVGGAITSPGIVDRAASTEAQRVAAAAPADAAVLANNPHMAYANQAYKGYSSSRRAPSGSTCATRRSTSTAIRPRACSRCGASASTPASRWSSTRAVPRRSEPASPALELVDVLVGEADRGLRGHEQRGRFAPRRPRAARVVVGVVDPRQRAVAGVGLDRVELPMARCRCAFSHGEGEKGWGIGQNERTEKVFVGLLLPTTAPDQVKGRGQAVQVLRSAARNQVDDALNVEPRPLWTAVGLKAEERENTVDVHEEQGFRAVAHGSGSFGSLSRSPVGQEGIRWCR